ncbi:hypothetical protein X975_12580, partial [Stegodyphus mimosarum]
MDCRLTTPNETSTPPAGVNTLQTSHGNMCKTVVILNSTVSGLIDTGIKYLTDEEIKVLLEQSDGELSDIDDPDLKTFWKVILILNIWKMKAF